MSDSRDWRQFEELVARIEAAATPRGAVVKSPDRIRDSVTGKLREVDASIRYRLGTVDILITIECRRRGRREDDTWIEQLASKRAKVGAAKTIAVSSSGFSDSARRTAEQYGIELRTLSEVSASEIDSWFMSSGAVHVFREVEEVYCAWFYREPDGTPEEQPFGVMDPLLPVFFHKDIESPFPAMVFVQFLEQSRPESFWSIPLDGTKTRLEFTISFPPTDLQVETDTGRRDVHHVIVSALVSYQSAACDLKDGQHHVYRSPSGPAVQHTSFQTRLFDRPVRFDHQSSSDGTHVSCEFLAPEKGRKA